MTNQEFSNEFDVLYNNITSNQAPGLDEYEKSVFLTKAEDEILRSYFDPRLNKPQEGFDGNEVRQIDFSNLIKGMAYNKATADYDTQGNVTSSTYGDPNTYEIIASEGSNSVDGRIGNMLLNIPADTLFIVNESVTVQRRGKKVKLNVVPITYTEYNRMMNKPYKRPLQYQAWRILTNDSTYAAGSPLGTRPYNTEVIVGPNDTIANYSIRYVRKPLPIILNYLGDGLSIEGYVGSANYGQYNGDLYDSTTYKPVITTKDFGDKISDYETSKAIRLEVAEKDNYSYINTGVGSEDVSNTNRIITKYNKPVSGAWTPAEWYYPIITDPSTKKGIECELDPIIHHEILQRAVELAKASYLGDLNSQLALGVNSQTNIGMTSNSSRQ